MPKKKPTELPAPEATEPQVTNEPAPRQKAKRGFAAISPERQREIARLGGKAAHAKGTAHEFTPEQAREAGRKGGIAAQKARQAAVAKVGTEDKT